jgi:hypothetical protein
LGQNAVFEIFLFQSINLRFKTRGTENILPPPLNLTYHSRIKMQCLNAKALFYPEFFYSTMQKGRLVVEDFEDE